MSPDQSLNDKELSGLRTLQGMKESEPSRSDLENELKTLRKKNLELTNEHQKLLPLKVANQELKYEVAKLRSEKGELKTEIEKLMGSSSLAALLSKNHQLIKENKELKKKTAENERKRKAAESELGSNKKAKTKDVFEKGVKIGMPVAHRKDVPDDVLNLVKILRNELRMIKKSNTRRIGSLERHADEHKKLAATAPPPPHPEKPKKKIPPEPVLTFEERLKLERAQATQDAASGGGPQVVMFEDRLKELKFFVRGNGHARVPTATGGNGGIGRWVMTIRSAYKRAMKLSPEKLTDKVCYFAGDLNVDRIAKLEALGFEWRVGPKIPPWEMRIRQLEAYREDHGTLETIRRNHPLLGEFVHTIRTAKRQKRIPHDRMKQLIEREYPYVVVFRIQPFPLTKSLNYDFVVGFIFETDFKHISFEERLEECWNFRRTHGHLNIPLPPPYAPVKPGATDEHSEEGGEREQPPPKEAKLRNWAQYQRAEYRLFQRGKKSRMDKTRIDTLNELGFVWEPRAACPVPNPPPRDTPRPVAIVDLNDKEGMSEQEIWEAHMAMLRFTCAQHGTIEDYRNIRQEFPDCYQELTNWLKLHRQRYRKKMAGHKTSLTDERQQQLEDIGFDFDPTGLLQETVDSEQSNPCQVGTEEGASSSESIDRSLGPGGPFQ
jgi:hypothetical protein